MDGALDDSGIHAICLLDGSDSAWKSAEYSVTVHGNSPGEPAYYSELSQPVVNGGSSDLVIFIGLCMTNIDFNVRNDDSVSHLYYQALSGSLGLMEGVLYLQPGQSGVSHGYWTCADGSNVKLFRASSNIFVGVGEGNLPNG